MSSKYTLPLESATRKRIDILLQNLNWEGDERKNTCNVFTERPKTSQQKKLLKGSYPDYVLYQSNTDEPIAIIETKKEGESLEKALKQAISYGKSLNANIIFVTDGTIVQTHDIRSNSGLYLDDQPITNLLSEKTLMKFVHSGARVYHSEKFSHTKIELIEIFKEANELLRKEGMREGVERFTEFSNLLFLKLISEIENEREESGEKRTLAKLYCWESFCNKKAEEMLIYINDTILPKLINQYNHSGEVFQRELAIKNPDTLKQIVDKLSGLSLLNTDSDVKGDAFEYFLRESVVVGNDLGEYFTPRHIVKLIVDLVDPAFGNRIYDPCCGTGGFLIEAYRNIKSKCKQTKENIKFLKEETIYGSELTGTAKIAKMNMIIIGDGHTNIVQRDSLKNPVADEDKYETILTNFPFSQTTDYSSYYGLTSPNANAVFLKHVIDALADGGRAGVVVPDGILFDKSQDNVKVRRILLETCELEAVIQLNTYTFRPYTGQPTCILIFTKGRPSKKVWFFDAVDDGFEKTGSKKGRKPIEANDLNLLRSIWKDKSTTENSFFVDVETIKKNSYKLNLNAYEKRTKRKVSTEKLSKLCKIEIGRTPQTGKREYWNGGSNLWATITDMTSKNEDSRYIEKTAKKITNKALEDREAKLFPKNTLLYSFKLSIGKVAFTSREMAINEAIVALTPLDKNDKSLADYLFYILPKIDWRPYAQRAAKGFTLNKDSLEDMDIPFPPKPIREKIVKEIQEGEIAKKNLKEKIQDIERKNLRLIKTNTE